MRLCVKMYLIWCARTKHTQLNFAPTISKESLRLAAAQPLRPIHERLGDLARAKFEKQQRLQHEQLERERKVAPFAPKLDSRSQVRVRVGGCLCACTVCVALIECKC